MKTNKPSFNPDWNRPRFWLEDFISLFVLIVILLAMSYFTWRIIGVVNDFFQMIQNFLEVLA